MSKSLLVFVVGLVVGGGLVYALKPEGRNSLSTGSSYDQVSNPPNSESPQPAVAGTNKVISLDTAQVVDGPTAEVLYTAQGFSPNSLRVKQGTTVTFKNQTNQKMWVASDPHPEHTDNPEFNQDQNGLSYAHEFDKPGIYNYHNHHNEQDTATIFVE